MDATTGHPLALIDGEALTKRRTAAASALASIYLSRPNSRRLLVVGAGALAPYMAAAHCAVRPIEKVFVWSRTGKHIEATVTRLKKDGLAAQVCSDLAAGLAAQRCGNKRGVGNRSRQNQGHQNEVAENDARPSDSAGVTGDFENAGADQNPNQRCVRFDRAEVAA